MLGKAKSPAITARK